MFTVSLDCSAVNRAVKCFEPKGSAQMFFTSELMRLSDKYVPFGNGPLKNSAMIEKDGTGLIYNTPYARLHWYGKLMVDPVTGKGAFFKEGYGFWSRPNTPKKLTDIDMQYNGAPMRGPRWVERCYIDNQSQLINATVEFAERNNYK